MATAELTDLWEPLARLDKDLRQASRLIGRNEARYLTDFYYQVQGFRIASAGQLRSSADAEPNRVLDWVNDSTRRLEGDIKKALGEFVDEYHVGKWLTSITGIGPVISAGLIAHLDIRRAKTYGHFWSFAGLNPEAKWGKGQKRPWNARLKVLMFKAGESFVKNQNRKNDHYGKLFVVRKALEVERNEAGMFADQAASALEDKNFRKDTDAYKAYSVGKLPPAHIHARARRYVSKLFLSHCFYVMYRDYYGTEPPAPYAFEHCEGDHRHFVPVPNWPFANGGKPLKELLD